MLARTLYPVFRRVDFRGKGRLRRMLPVPGEGVVEAGFPGGMRLRLDLRESIQRDWYAGLYDRRELRVLRELLAEGGDFVDVGAHIGLYALTGARATKGRVLALEPNPSAREQLEHNVALNDATDVIVRPVAASANPGRAQLHVPRTPDPSFSSLGGGRFSEADPIDVEVTTVDAEVEALRLRPTVVKIDVEGAELDVIAGMTRTLREHRPTLLVEVSEESARELMRRLEGYSGFRVGATLEPLESGRGLFNALFVPQPPVSPL